MVWSSHACRQLAIPEYFVSGAPTHSGAPTDYYSSEGRDGARVVGVVRTASRLDPGNPGTALLSLNRL